METKKTSTLSQRDLTKDENFRRNIFRKLVLGSDYLRGIVLFLFLSKYHLLLEIWYEVVIEDDNLKKPDGYGNSFVSI